MARSGPPSAVLRTLVAENPFAALIKGFTAAFSNHFP
jgi:hypothetical protein